MTARGQRISTLTYEPDAEEPVLDLRPASEQFPVPKDSQDFAILPGERLVLARASLVADGEGRLELRSLEEWEPIPYAVLPLRPPLVIDETGTRALVHADLIDGYEASLAVVDLDRFEVLRRMPFTAPFAFLPTGDGARDADEMLALPPPSGGWRSSAPPPPRGTIAPPPRSTVPPPPGPLLGLTEGPSAAFPETDDSPGSQRTFRATVPPPAGPSEFDPPRPTQPPLRSTQPPARSTAPPSRPTQPPLRSTQPPSRSTAPPSGARSTVPPPARGVRGSVPPPGALVPYQPRGSVPVAAMDARILATLPHAIADRALINAQPYAEAIRARMIPGPRGPMVSSRSTAMLEYTSNVLHRVFEETAHAGRVLVPDPSTAIVVTEDDVRVRCIELPSGRRRWDVGIGKTAKGSIYTCYAAAYAEHVLGRLVAVAVYDRRVDLIEIDGGNRVAQLWLHEESRARIDALAWSVGGTILAIGLANGTLMLCWPPTVFHDPWRVRVFRGASKGIRALHFHPDGGYLFVLGKEGALRVWALLEDELD